MKHLGHGLIAGPSLSNLLLMMRTPVTSNIHLTTDDIEDVEDAGIMILPRHFLILTQEKRIDI